MEPIPPRKRVESRACNVLMGRPISTPDFVGHRRPCVPDNNNLMVNFAQEAEIQEAHMSLKTAYVYLVLAIIAETVATSSLKAAEQFTRPLPSLMVVVGYGTSFYLLTQVLRRLPLGLTYALWSGLGIVLVTLAGMILYREKPDLPALIGLALIIAGIVVVNLWSTMVRHS